MQPPLPVKSGFEKSTVASPKVLGEIAPSPPLSSAGIALVLIDPVAMPPALRFVRLPQHGTLFEASHCEPAPAVTHFDSHSVGLVPPCERSYWISRSFVVRTGVTPLADSTFD